MAIQLTNPTTEGSELPNQSEKDLNGAVANDSVDKLSFEAPQPMREDQVQNAVKFLSHPRVRGSPVVYRRSFLEKKGLTKEEIDEAFRRVPDPPPSSTSVEAAGPNHASQGLASHTAVQTPQSVVAPAAAAPLLMKTVSSRFRWYHVLLTAGILSGCAASAGVFFQKVLVPRLKAWIRKVVAQGDETENSSNLNTQLVEETAEAAKTAASASACVAKTSQELLAAKNEEMKLFDGLKRALDLQVKEMKSMAESIRKLERRKEDSFSQEEYAYSALRNGPVINSWRASQTYAHGSSNADFGSGRPSVVPVATEPSSAAYQKSYMEDKCTTQRVDRASGSKVVCPEHYSPADKQSWEVSQYGQHMSVDGSLSQLSDDGSSFEAQENYIPPYQLNGKAHDASDTWRKKAVKITEVNSEVEEPRQFPLVSGADERTIQKRWVPPQPPAIVMPEAAAAIRQPKSIPKQQSGDERLVTGIDNGVDGVPKAFEAFEVDEVENGTASMDVSHSVTQEVQLETTVV